MAKGCILFHKGRDLCDFFLLLEGFFVGPFAGLSHRIEDLIDAGRCEGLGELFRNRWERGREVRV